MGLAPATTGQQGGRLLPSALRARDLAFGVAQRKLLDGIDLDVAPGEMIAVVGPSGSGKTTLLQVLAGIKVPDAGSIWLGDEELTGASTDARARLRLAHIGFVFQFGELLPELSVQENVGLPLRLLGRRRGDADTAASEMLELVGVHDLGPASPLTLSGGEVQRIAVARALVHRPVVVLADEPTGSLDRANAKAIWSLLSDIAKHLATAVVVVTHNLELAASADRTLELGDGRLRPVSSDLQVARS